MTISQCLRPHPHSAWMLHNLILMSTVCFVLGDPLEKFWGKERHITCELTSAASTCSASQPTMRCLSHLYLFQPPGPVVTLIDSDQQLPISPEQPTVTSFLLWLTRKRPLLLISCSTTASSWTPKHTLLFRIHPASFQDTKTLQVGGKVGGGGPAQEGQPQTFNIWKFYTCCC